MKALRVYHTVKYLKAIQIISRITRKLKFVRRKKTNGKLSPTSSNYKNITLLPSSYVGDNQFVFLNDPDFITNWNDPNKSKLWLYNLHYFDDLNQDDYQDRDWLHIGLLDTWIEENPFMQGNGWEPYPLSLRIVNWIKWFLSTKIQPKQHWLDSLLQQVNALEQQLEYHLLGNHLFANAKALVFAGCYFDNSDAIRWLRKGFSILEAEVDEQILPDGGHFELSPMYHNIILTDMLDLYNLMSTFSNKLPIPDYWVDTIRNMFSWSSRMSHPDGGVSFFNDSAFGVAPILSSLIDYAYELDIFWNEMLELPTDVFNYCHLIDSGYISLSTLNYKAIIDVANVGPDYIPGHAHADTLSFELSIGGQRVIVNSGTSEYGLSQERLRQRKTSSHNTVVVNEKDSSEVWSAFRVAKRARAKNLKVLNYNDSIDVTCSHDGYQRICKDLIHTRSWSFHPNMVTVLDEVSGQASSCQAHYHLHPEVSVDFISRNEVGLTLANGVQLKLVSDHSIKIQDTTWHPEFGRAIASKKLIITFDKTVTTRIFLVMHILFLTDNFPPEGNAPATRTYEHAIRWVEAGHKVTIITCVPNFPEGKVFEGYTNRWYQIHNLDGINVVRVKTFITANEGFGKRILDYLSFMVTGFIAGLFQNKPDVIVATSPQFFCACAGWALSTVRRKPFVFELRDIWPASITAVGAMKDSLAIRVLEKIEMFLYRRADSIVSVTHAFKKELIERGVDGKKIEVVLNGVDLTKYKPSSSKDTDLAKQYDLEGKFVAGYIGTHGMAHGLEHIVGVAERLQNNDDIRVLFAGGGAARQKVVDLVERKQLKNVVLIDRQPKEMMPKLWSLCDVSLVPLVNSDLFRTVIPSKIFECMGMGIPTIMSVPEGEATEIIRETDSGLVVESESVDNITAAVLKLQEDKELYQRIRNSSIKAAPKYSRDIMAMDMESIFTKCAS